MPVAHDSILKRLAVSTDSVKLQVVNFIKNVRGSDEKDKRLTVIYVVTFGGSGR